MKTKNLLCLDCGTVDLPDHIAAAYGQVPKRLGFVTYDDEDYPRLYPDYETPQGKTYCEWEARQNRRYTEWFMAGGEGEFQLEDFG